MFPLSAPHDAYGLPDALTFGWLLPAGSSASGFRRPALPTVIARMQPAVCFFEETRSMVVTRRSGDLFSIAVIQKRIFWSRSPALPAPVQASVDRLADGPSILSAA